MKSLNNKINKYTQNKLLFDFIYCNYILNVPTIYNDNVKT